MSSGGSSSSGHITFESHLGPPPVISTSKKIQWADLYAAFFDSPNFGWWLKSRLRAARTRIRDLYLAALYDADIPAWINGKDEIVVVDLLLRLRSQLSRFPDDPPKIRSRIAEHVDVIVSYLPDDLQASLKANGTL